jgi:hypothetical protein
MLHLLKLKILNIIENREKVFSLCIVNLEKRELVMKKVKLSDEAKRCKRNEKRRMRYALMSDKKRKSVIEKQIEWNRNNAEKCCEYVKKYQKNNKMRHIAHKVASSVKCPEGMVRHHWSYSVENMKDLLFVTAEEHYFIHRYLIYVDYNYCFKTVGGVMLNTKDKHDAYISLLLDFQHCVKDMVSFCAMFGF